MTQEYYDLESSGQEIDEAIKKTKNMLTVDNLIQGHGIVIQKDENNNITINNTMAEHIQLLFLDMNENIPILTNQQPSEKKIIMPITSFSAAAGEWIDFLTVNASDNIKDMEVQFIPNSRFSAKLWIISARSRDNIQIRMQVIDTNDNTVLASATTKTNLLGEETIPSPILFENIHQELRELPLSQIQIVMSIMPSQSGVQIGVISNPLDEISYINITTSSGLNKDGMSAYEIAVKNGFEGTEQEWLNSITTIVEGENILNRTTVGVSGVMENLTFSGDMTQKLAFIPLEGSIKDIDSDGNWVCPKDGVYSLSADIGHTDAVIGRWLYFTKNMPEFFDDENKVIAMSYVANVPFISINTTVKVNKGDIISLWLNAINTAMIGNPSFTITLESSVNIDTFDLYEQWKKEDPSRENISFDKWVRINTLESLNDGGISINTPSIVDELGNDIPLTDKLQFVNAEVRKASDIIKVTCTSPDTYTKEEIDNKLNQGVVTNLQPMIYINATDSDQIGLQHAQHVTIGKYLYTLGHYWGASYPDILRYDLDLKIHTRLGELPVGIHAGSANYDEEDTIYVIGGNDGSSVFNSLYKYTVSKNTTVKVSANIPQARYGHSSAHHNGNLYLFGGRNASNTCQNTIYRYSISENKWYTLTAKLTNAVETYHTAVKIGNKVYICGGHKTDGTTIKALDIFDLETETVTKGEDMPLGGAGFKAILKEDHFIMLSGTTTTDGDLDGIGQRYDIPTNKWSIISVPGLHGQSYGPYGTYKNKTTTFLGYHRGGLNSTVQEVEYNASSIIACLDAEETIYADGAMHSSNGNKILPLTPYVATEREYIYIDEDITHGWTKAKSFFTDDELERQKAMLAWKAAVLDTEYWTGEYHTDGKKIYGKIIYMGNLPNVTGEKSVLHGISNLYDFCSMECMMSNRTAQIFRPLPASHGSTLSANISFEASTPTTIRVYVFATGLGAYTATATLTYTCTDR